jgi:hypothetical protein
MQEQSNLYTYVKMKMSNVSCILNNSIFECRNEFSKPDIRMALLSDQDSTHLNFVK